jgi:glycosyltransferase involved in cell wall biosynthesis
MEVFGDVHHDARVLREAGALAGAGADVTIVGIRRAGDPAVERRGNVLIRRVPVGWRRSLPGSGRIAALAPIRLRRTFAFLGRLITLLAWQRRSARVVPASDAHHGHDLPGLAIAWAHARRGRGMLVYDSHELFLESGFNRELPRLLRRVFGAVEGWLARRATLVVTVNESIADELVARYGIARPVVVRNCPPRWRPEQRDAPRFDRFRERLPISPERPIVLYQGAFHADRGIQVTVAALERPELEDAVLVCLGSGVLEGWLIDQTARPELADRLFVLPQVPVDRLLEWTASADVLVAVYEASDLNNRLSTPNKLYEALAAGVPVVTSDFPERARFIAETRAGALADPGDPAAVARAIGSLLALPAEQRLDLRRRARRASLERYNWETESRTLLDAYRRLLGAGS